MKHSLLSFLLLFSLNSFSQTLEDDRLSLVALYNAANGVQWAGNNWVIPGLPGDNPCGWSGIGCEGGRVTSVDVSGETLSGTIPAQIGNLTALKKLIINARFSSTHLTGNLPVELGNLINLEELDIAGHAFGSKNAEVIGNLVNLKTLWFTPLWAIPEQIFTLAKLENLVLSLGQASLHVVPIGPVPVGLMNMISLKNLTISSIGFTGQLPIELGNLTNLKSLIIGETLLEGKIPSSIGSLTNLTRLGISGITYAGPIPPELGKLTKLTELILYYNTHTGTIPKELNNLVNAREILLDGGFLSGPLPDLSALKPGVLSVEHNSFTFDGIEGHTDRYYSYGNQNEIPLHSGNGQIFVNAGGTLSKNTFKWYLNNVLQATIVGDNKFVPSSAGGYRVEVSNSDVPGLTLISETLGSSLPVNLISINIESSENGNRVTWQTASETNNKGFEIEKSADARTFTKIGFVDGSGDSKELNNYHFTDQNPFNLSYYRLKQLDYDGKFEYSKIVMARNALDLKVYPNPARDYLMVSGLEKEGDLLIIDQNGRAVFNQRVNTVNPIDVRKIATGIYTLKIGDHVKKIAIQK
jgi:Leucine-rich repeat (LRR) protein